MLKQLAADSGCLFLDNSSLLTDGSEYYGTDGMHVSGKFYTEVWLPYLVSELGL